MLEACKQSRSPYLYLVVVLALSTGARKSEILTLRWSDVDLTRGVITLQKTKNRDRRALPLTGYALDLMHQHAKVRSIDTDLVFPGRNRQSPADVGLAWEKARSRAGITDFRFHDLRHSAASYLAMNGASLAEIAEVLGHKSFDMLKRRALIRAAHGRRGGPNEPGDFWGRHMTRQVQAYLQDLAKTLKFSSSDVEQRDDGTVDINWSFEDVQININCPVEGLFVLGNADPGLAGMLSRNAALKLYHEWLSKPVIRHSERGSMRQDLSLFLPA